MHSTQTHAMVFFHNGDFSGPVRFRAVEPATGVERDVAAPFPVLARAASRPARGVPDHTEVTVEVRAEGGSEPYGDPVTVVVPVGALRDLVGKRVERDRVARLEQMSYADLFFDGLGAEVLGWLRETPDWT